MDTALYTGIIIVKNSATYSHLVEVFLKEMADSDKT